MCSSTASAGFDAVSVDFLRNSCPLSAVTNYSCAEILDLHLILQGVCLIKNWKLHRSLLSLSMLGRSIILSDVTPFFFSLSLIELGFILC